MPLNFVRPAANFETFTMAAIPATFSPPVTVVGPEEMLGAPAWPILVPGTDGVQATYFTYDKEWRDTYLEKGFCGLDAGFRSHFDHDCPDEFEEVDQKPQSTIWRWITTPTRILQRLFGLLLNDDLSNVIAGIITVMFYIVLLLGAAFPILYAGSFLCFFSVLLVIQLLGFIEGNNHDDLFDEDPIAASHSTRSRQRSRRRSRRLGGDGLATLASRSGQRDTNPQARRRRGCATPPRAGAETDSRSETDDGSFDSDFTFVGSDSDLDFEVVHLL